MWLFNRPPLEQLKALYGFEPTPAWLEHVQKSSVRFADGGSGSFISADGLVITNHHIAEYALQKLSDAAHNYVRDGFYAKSRGEEVRCLDLELNVLMDIEDVTARIKQAVAPGMSADEAFAAHRAVVAAVEKESSERTGLRSEVVTLDRGGAYHLYRYKRYTDVRLVFAPEQQAAFFGGDPDNFEYPRYDFDIALFRVYEAGRPAKIEHYLTWNRTGLKDGELVFVSGHPGSTQRLLTLAELEYERDVRVPKVLANLNHLEVALIAFSARGAENARRARVELFGVQNARKLYGGFLAGLLDPALLRAKQAEEDALQAAAAKTPDGDAAWRQIADAQRIISRQAVRANLLAAYNYRTAFTYPVSSTLLDLARKLYRVPAERARPNGERLAEYRDSARPELELALFSGEPIYDDFEQLQLTHWLTMLATELGPNDPAVQIALGGQSPPARAAQLVQHTRLRDVAFRRQLSAMTPDQIARVDDSYVALVRDLDDASRAVRRSIEQQLDAKERAHARIARLRHARDSAQVSPDATFTLRLAFGTVKGYEENGQPVAPFTTLAGLYQRSAEHDNKVPFDLPPRWAAERTALDLGTPLNFVTTCDIVGGNSGSPTINRDAEFVGIIFDGNIQSLILDYAYTEVQSRSVSVDARAILEALRKVYGADALVQEILTGHVS
ncbi:MAG TPA: S46 family peptidase [Opitutaceae bacterium]|nr:S46 family peptidase [Opitutaceae bacterium]